MATLTRQSATVRLIREPLDLPHPPERVLAALADRPCPFALTGRWAGGGAIVGSDPLLVAGPGEDPFATLDRLPVVDGEPTAVGGGWFGWLGFGSRPPGFHLAYHDNVLRRDAENRWWFEALVTPERERGLSRRLVELRRRLSGRAGTSPYRPPPAFRLSAARARYHRAAVAACVARIHAGELSQANICLRLETAWTGEMTALFAAAVAKLRPAYGASFPGVASLSPELFLRRRGRLVETAPIKGTAPASTAPEALLASAKDRAENVMIVDLMRNDLGMVCEYGSITASRTPELEPHPGVWHLVTPVRGRLRAGVGDGDLLRATFPPGSVTGAPKIQATKVIAALERDRRYVYTGAIGFASPLAGLELSVAIRTFEAAAGRLWLGAGGGIVSDSDPAAELEECLVKARPLVAAIGSRIECG